jgi:hypothetical protein
MLHDPLHRSRAIAVSTAFLAFLAVPALADESRSWTYSIAAGVSPRYGYRTDSFGSGNAASFENGFSFVGGAIRPVTRRVSMVVEGGYHVYGKPIGIIGIPELPPTTGRLRAEFYSLGVGLRLQPWSDPSRPSPYAQITPALYVSRWEEHIVDHEGYDLLSGSYRQRSTHVESFRNALPGVALSAGVSGRIAGVVGSDIAVRVTRSADLGEHGLGRFSSGDFHGLTEVALLAGLTWSP